MSKIIRSACPLDCFDACAMLVTVEDGKVIKVTGDPDHPVTKGFICRKGRAQIDRLYSSDRLLSPLLKVDGRFQEISWEEAIDTIADKLGETIETHGKQSIMHISDCGYSGMSKSVDDMFFNHLGGISKSKSPGSLCWTAGNVAQKIDFGSVKGHSAEDLSNSKCMIIWGRNPAVTNIHFMQALRDVKKNGGEVICIDPFRTKTAELSDRHIQVKPGADGALAFAMARIMIDEGLCDQNFIEKHTKGFEVYEKEVMAFDMSNVETLTGLKFDEIKSLSRVYATAEPASIILGYGMQRYINGGQNIRTIDALGALSGNIGKSGGGVTYANKSISKFVKGYVDESEELSVNARYYKPAEVASYIENTKAPHVEFLWIAKANPVVQGQNTEAMIDALQKTEFVVVVDMFMTDTAVEADLILPATSIFEEEDFIYSSMYSPYLNYAHRCLEAPNGMISEYELFKKLAKRMNIQSYPQVTREEFFRHALRPLMTKFDVTYESLQEDPFALPDQGVPWQDKVFETPSGQFEFESDRAMELDLNQVISFHKSTSAPKDYPFRLISPHDGRSTNSQHFRNINESPKIFMAVEEAKQYGFELNEEILVESEYGQLKAVVKPDGYTQLGVVKVVCGQWRAQGTVNSLIGELCCKYGDQAAYYDTFVKLSKSDFAK